MTPRSATAAALVVDALTGEGGVVELLLVARPGDGQIQCRQRAREDAALAVQTSISAALGPELARWSLEWSLRDVPFPVKGRSLGLAAAVAAKAAVAGRDVPPGWGFTGAVDLTGRVDRVAGTPEKLRAAATAGLARVALPAANLEGRAPPEGIALVAVESLGPLFDRLFPARGRLAKALGALAAGPLLALLLAPTPPDLWLQSRALVAAHGALAAPATAVVLLPADRETAAERRALRADHPRLIRDLVAAGASSITFDLDLSDPSPHDAALAAAVREASDAGVVVIGAAPWGLDDRPRRPADPALRDALQPGLSSLEIERRGLVVLGRARPVRLALGDEGAPPEQIWHLAVQAANARLRSAPPPALDSEAEILTAGGQRHRLSHGWMYLHPADRPPRLDYDAPDNGALDLRGRAILVGAADPKDTWSTSWGDRHGVELHAGLIEALCAGRIPRVVGPAGNAVLAAAAAGLAASGRRRWRWALLALGVVVLGAAGLRAVLFAPLLPAAAVAAGWFVAEVVGEIRRGHRG